ncbi:MAG: hypothetical protein H6Q67_1037 [Firmicutes bacterium]|nr:hypothetical protein [Bacillota bacterium]
MAVVVIGGDYLGIIKKNLYTMGATEVLHISGRKASNRNKINFPKTTGLVLVLTDYVNHCTANSVKSMAKSQAIPVVFSKRSWSAVEKKLQKNGMLCT